MELSFIDFQYDNSFYSPEQFSNKKNQIDGKEIDYVLKEFNQQNFENRKITSGKIHHDGIHSYVTDRGSMPRLSMISRQSQGLSFKN